MEALDRGLIGITSLMPLTNTKRCARLWDTDSKQSAAVLEKAKALPVLPDCEASATTTSLERLLLFLTSYKFRGNVSDFPRQFR